MPISVILNIKFENIKFVNFKKLCNVNVRI